MVTIFKKQRVARLAGLALALCLLVGSFASCSGESEIPEGYQYATCAGEYFRLFIPTQWTVNTQSGMSAGHLNIYTSVSMTEVTVEGNFTDENGQSRTATLEDFRLSHLAEIGTLRDFELGEMFNASLGGYSAVRVTYTATVTGKSYRFLQVLTRVSGRFYLFTYSTLKEEFDTYMDIVDEILENVLFYNTPYEGDADPRKVSDKVTAPEGMRLVSTDKVAYRLFVPSAWTDAPESGVDLVYVEEGDGSRSNVTMMAYMPEEEGFSVADYWEMCRLQYADALPGFEVTAIVEDEKIGERNATVYEYTYTLGGVTYKTRQAVCVYSTMVYTLTYTALPEYYESHLSDVQAIQRNVVFRSPFKKG